MDRFTSFLRNKSHKYCIISQKFSCRTKEEKLLCLYTVGIICSSKRFTSLTITVSPDSDQPPIVDFDILD